MDWFKGKFTSESPIIHIIHGKIHGKILSFFPQTNTLRSTPLHRQSNRWSKPCGSPLPLSRPNQLLRGDHLAIEMARGDWKARGDDWPTPWFNMGWYGLIWFYMVLYGLIWFNDIQWYSMMIQDFIMIHELCKPKTSKHTMTQQDLKHQRCIRFASRFKARFSLRSQIWQCDGLAKIVSCHSESDCWSMVTPLYIDTIWNLHEINIT